MAAGKPEDVAAMFFTSGTTGNPKGVVHTHYTLLDRAQAGQRFDKLTNAEEVLAHMPLAWVGQNIFSHAQWLACGYGVNCPESAATLVIDLQEFGPTYYFAPPRVFEDLLTSVMIRMEGAGRIKRWLFHRFKYLARRVGAMLAVEGVRSAQESFGKGKVMLGELACWGYENLNLTQARLDALGFKGVMRPVSTSCFEHMGSAWARVHTWDGAKFTSASDWLQANQQIIKPLVKASGERDASEKKIEQGAPADCQS